MKRTLATIVAALTLLFVSTSHANQLACIAQLCLSGGASCGNAKFPGCGVAVGQYCHFLGLFKGLSKATNWLNSCRYEGSSQVVDFAMACTSDRIYNHLQFVEYQGDNGPIERIRFDVPDGCKQFVQQTESATRAALSQLTPEQARQVPHVSLLPVMTMRWHSVIVTDGYGTNLRVQYTPEYKWVDPGRIPGGYSMVYNPNSGERYRCPVPHRQAPQTVYSTTSGC